MLLQPQLNLPDKARSPESQCVFFFSHVAVQTLLVTNLPWRQVDALKTMLEWRVGDPTESSHQPVM